MESDPTFDELAGKTRPVGIECGHCYRRVLIDPVRGLRARKGDRRRLSQASLHCSRCGSRTFSVHLFPSDAKATAFLRNH